MRTDYIVAGAILLVALGGVGLYLYSRRLAEQKKRAAIEKRIASGQPIEHPLCDPHRSKLAAMRAELANVHNDPLKEGNIRGAIAIEQAQLTECERTEARNELL